MEQAKQSIRTNKQKYYKADAKIEATWMDA